MKKSIIFYNLFFFIICVFAMFSIKYKFHKLNKELVKIVRELDIEQEDNNVLRAEYSYMNNPERLSILAKRYLNYKQQNIENFDFHLYKKIYDHDISVFKLVNKNFSRHN